MAAISQQPLRARAGHNRAVMLFPQCVTSPRTGAHLTSAVRKRPDSPREAMSSYDWRTALPERNRALPARRTRAFDPWRVGLRCIGPDGQARRGHGRPRRNRRWRHHGRARRDPKSPIREAFTNSWRDMLRVMGMALMNVIPVVTSIFGAAYAVQPAYGSASTRTCIFGSPSWATSWRCSSSRWSATCRTSSAGGRR